jgi:hypothetical protein
MSVVVAILLRALVIDAYHIVRNWRQERNGRT